MPLPVWLIILAIAGVGAAVLAAMTLKKWLSERGHVAFIGRNMTGKSTMLYFLQHGQIPRNGLASTEMQIDESGVSIGEKQFVVIDNKGNSLPNLRDSLHRSSDIIYFFDASKVAEGDAKAVSALEADASHLEEFLKEVRFRRRFTLVGTHTDLMERGGEETVRNSPALQTLKHACSIGDGDVILGSLVNKRQALKLAASVAKRHNAG
jgi:hypothetical protein